MSKFGIAALAVIGALVLSFAVRTSTPTADAEVTATRAVWCGFIDAIANCDDGVDANDVQDYADALGNEDGTLEPADLDDVQAFGGNQITDGGAGNLDEILIFAFVDDDAVVTFDAEAGVTVAVNLDSGPGFSADLVSPETCEAADDLDCDDSVADDGDGVAVATITDNTSDEGDEIGVDVLQEGIGESQTLNVVGSAFGVDLTLVETTIQSDAAATCADGTLEVTDSDALGNPDSTIAIAVVSDNDDRALTRILTGFDSSDTDIAEIGDETIFSIDAGASGVAAFAVVCGGDDTGTADVIADIGTDDDSAEITVVGEPDAIALTASPAQIACDGVQTSTVTATVTDAEGNPVANGVGVRFDVVALGTANPINATTTDGTASSVITPLSGATAGVTVIVTAGDASASIRVDCALPVPTPTTAGPAPTATPPGGIVGPVTGTGGYLTQDGASLPLWSLIALALGSVALVAGGMVTRKASK